MLAINIIIITILTFDFQRPLWSMQVRNPSPYFMEEEGEGWPDGEACPSVMEFVRGRPAEPLVLEISPSFNPAVAWVYLP